MSKKFKVGKIPNKSVQNFSIKDKDKEFSVTIQEPDFSQLSLAMTEMTGLTGKINLVGAGASIFDTCCVEYDEEIEKNPRLKMAICLRLTEEYLGNFDYEVKKN